MTTLYRVGWTDEDGETCYSIATDDPKLVGELCKTVDTYPVILRTADVWIETCEVEWARIKGKR